MSDFLKTDPTPYQQQEQALEAAIGMPFRFIGHYDEAKAFALTVHSPVLARELAKQINDTLGLSGDGHQASVVQLADFFTGTQVRIAFPRWSVRVPVELVTDSAMETLTDSPEIRDTLGPFINTLREKVFDALEAAASAATCRKEFEAAIAEERLQRHKESA